MSSLDVAAFHRAYERHPGDRARLFAAAAAAIDVRSVLYPGSYVDVAASCVWDELTYVDTDRRAASFFDQEEAVRRLIAPNRTHTGPFSFTFVRGDYRDRLPMADASVDLLVSLYAGFVSVSCSRYLRRGGRLLVNDSHGDASMASLQPDLRLSGVIKRRRRGYAHSVRDLDEYLQPREEGLSFDESAVRARGRGIPFRRTAAAYIYLREPGSGEWEAASDG